MNKQTTTPTTIHFIGVFALIAASAILFTACSEPQSSGPAQNGGKGGFPAGFLGFNGTDTIYALLRYDYTDDVIPGGGLNPNAAVQAFLRDSLRFVNATSVSANTQALTNAYNGSNLTGQYSLDGPNVSTSSNPTVAWSIVGYLGSNFSQTYDLAPRFNVSGLAFIDTVSKATGLTKSYSNIVSGDSIVVALEFESLLSGEYIHPDSTTGDGYVVKTTTDNGSVSISSSELSALTPHRLYKFSIQRAKYATTTYQGKKIGVVSVYSITNWIYLAP